MNVLIIEDEALAAERLKMLLYNYDKNIKVTAVLESIEEAIACLSTQVHPDVLLVDIHLADGHSFEIFKTIKTTKPVIFTTAYDQYALDAFQLFSIDYILKPITAEALANAINKYKNIIQQNLPTDINNILEQVKENFSLKYKNRFLAKVGQRIFFVMANEVACFFAENKIVYIITKEGNKLIINTTIERLEKIIDPTCFFKINRSAIINIEAVEQAKPYDNNRLSIVLKCIGLKDELIVSRERVQDFKTWADN